MAVDDQVDTATASEDPTFERIDGPTPNGGSYAIAYFLDAQLRPTTKAKARRVEIHEMSDSGDSLFRTWFDRDDVDAA